MTHDEVFAKVREILVADFKVPPEKVTGQASFRGTLGMDSLDAVDLIYLLGKAFKVKATVDQFKDLHSVEKVVEHLLKATAPKEPGQPG
jgi:acyl carrier protein